MTDEYPRPSPLVPIAIFGFLLLAVSVGLVVVLSSGDDEPSKKATVLKSPKSKPSASEPEVTTSAGLLGLTGFVCVVAVVMPLIGFVAMLFALAWVAKDAKNRGMDGAALWMGIVFLTFRAGFLVYLMARPQGALTPCTHCGNVRLLAALACPHCGDKS
jgi:hypothetical protein